MASINRPPKKTKAKPLRIQQGTIQPNQLPTIQHLIVDEYQDLNACDQEFVWLLTMNGATLFVAGDDDQSIYAFRHANPSGIVQFTTTYPAAASRTLNACFRCTPAVLTPATAMIAFNPNRLQKNPHSLYATAAPPVSGSMHIWSFPTADDEARRLRMRMRPPVPSPPGERLQVARLRATYLHGAH